MHVSLLNDASAQPLPRRIAVFRALQSADLLAAVPALRALRHAYPRARITLIGLPWAGSFVQRFGYCDEFMEFPGFPGLPERAPNIAALPAFFQLARAQRFDLVLQMHDAGAPANAVVEQLGAKASHGYKRGVGKGPEHYLSWDEREPEVQRWLRLMSALGIAARSERLEFPLMPHEMREGRALLNRYLPLSPRPFVCVHPSLPTASRHWTPERVAHVADSLARRGYTVVLTGAKDDIQVGEALRRAMRKPAVNLIGKTSLGGLAAVIRQARLVVCNDSGMSHVAAAMRTPSVSLTGMSARSVIDTACRLLTPDQSRAA